MRNGSACVLAICVSALLPAVALADQPVVDNTGGTLQLGNTGGTSQSAIERAAKRRAAAKKQAAARKRALRLKKARELREKRAVKKPAKPKPKPKPDSGLPSGTFPLKGEFSFGNEDNVFGAHRGEGKNSYGHRGQDVLAALGTPMVSPRAGTVLDTGYGAAAGYFIVIQDAQLDLTYVFMHIRKGTTVVNEGDTVRAGTRIADVGETGDAIGSHLHFEVWKGGYWTETGEPVDPLPYLKNWAT